MLKEKFIVELNSTITPNDHIVIRTLYSSIINWSATNLYFVLLDFKNTSKNNISFLLTEIKKILKFDDKSFMEAKKKLEAVGLLTTHRKEEEKMQIFNINKPSSTKIFRKNKLLYQMATANIGELTFERVHFSLNKSAIDKMDFDNITATFQEVFTIKPKVIDVEIKEFKNKYDSVDEAIESLTSMQFIFHLTNKKTTRSQLVLIEKLQSLGFSNISLNEIINYTYESNGQIVNNYIKTIANDFIKKQIIKPYDVKHELLKARKKGVSKFMVEPDIEIIKNDKIINIQEIPDKYLEGL